MTLFDLVKNEMVGKTIIVHKYKSIGVEYEVEPYISHGSAIKYKGEFPAVIKNVRHSKKKHYDFIFDIEVEDKKMEIHLHDMKEIKFYEANN